ncbi:hypothetical protein ASG35_29290 [Burkholderia sp. Leaf177]|nr:hypothetical protein ASG35_29290 [Burkholderia sp. Leaf177]
MVWFWLFGKCGLTVSDNKRGRWPDRSMPQRDDGNLTPVNAPDRKSTIIPAANARAARDGCGKDRGFPSAARSN